MADRLFTFVGGDEGTWRIVGTHAIVGDTLPDAARLRIVPGPPEAALARSAWRLRGVTSHERYVTRAEKSGLVAVQPGLGRPEATRAALIPIRKSDDWWGLPQDERRRVFEEMSGHIRIGLEYLPAVARRLHHCRDLGDREPFDFLTWFEFAAADESAFDDLVARLRDTNEWRYVTREVDIRLVRD